MPFLDVLKSFFKSNGYGADCKRSPAYNFIQFGVDPHEVWDVVSDLGDGAFGKVQKVIHKENKTFAAAKAIELQNEDDIDEYLVEIEILTQCRHKNIVRLYEVFLWDHSLWLMLEFCGGGAVDSIMVELEKPLSEPQIRYICHELCEALRFLHKCHVIHRDLKAGNILLTSEGEVKLGDFGVSAKSSDSLQRRTTFIGTPYWMAPEVMICETFKEQPYGSKCDIWSLGITLIELAEMEPPYHEMSPMRVVFKIQKSDPPTLCNPSKWSGEFHNFLSRCLVKNPNERDSADMLIAHSFVAAQNDRKPILQLLSELKADVIAEVVEEIEEEDRQSSHSIESTETLTPSFSTPVHCDDGAQANAERFDQARDVVRSFCSDEVDLAKNANEADERNALESRNFEQRAAVSGQKRPAPRGPPESESYDLYNSTANEILDALYESLSNEERRKVLDQPRDERQASNSFEHADAAEAFNRSVQGSRVVDREQAGVLRVTVHSAVEEPADQLPLKRQSSVDKNDQRERRPSQPVTEMRFCAFAKETDLGEKTISADSGSFIQIRKTEGTEFGAEKLYTGAVDTSGWKFQNSANVDVQNAAAQDAYFASEYAEPFAESDVPSSNDQLLTSHASPSNLPASALQSCAFVESQAVGKVDEPPPEPPIDYEMVSVNKIPFQQDSSTTVPIASPVNNRIINGSCITESAPSPSAPVVSEERPISVLRKTSANLDKETVAEKPMDTVNGNVFLARRNPHRRTVTKKTRVFVVDGVQVTSTTYHVMSDDDTHLYKAKEDFRLRKAELQEMRRLQREEVRQFQELSQRAEMQREQQSRKFEQDLQTLLREYENEVDSIMRCQKKQLEEAEKIQEDDMKIATKRLKVEEERELKHFREVLRQEHKLLKQEMDFVPKHDRKEMYRQRKELLDAQQADRERQFVERVKNAHTLTLNRLDDSHRQKITLLERQFLQQKHQMLRAREAALWELEERQLHERHQLLKNQMKESFFLQRSHMLVRHQKELEHVKKVSQRKEDEAIRAQASERKRLPKILRSETKTRTMMFRESLKIRMLDPGDIASKLREFEERERYRIAQEVKKQEVKHRKRLELLRAENETTVKELEQLQNEKRKLLLEHENLRLKLFDEEYANELKAWKSQLKPRKQKLEEKFAGELNEQERFYEQTLAGSPSLPGSYISSALISGGHGMSY
uniref:Protein kinase domain-containing protein n=1 Tax=Trichuris muris TaxID=70415 RepID=A0A5S6QJG6_TRIMR